MDIREFNKRLKKITVLFESMSENNVVSALEQDLMLSYIRDLYEVTMEGNVVSKKSDIVLSESAQHFSVPEIVDTPTVIEERPVFDFREKISTPQPVAAEMVATPKQEPSVKEAAPSPVAPVAISSPDLQAMTELFQEAKVTDLSDKLALTPIKDLSKGMGINEKIFTIQELFANNQEHFNNVINTLNQCADFSQAKSYLMSDVIPKYDWTSENKLKKAVTFIRMVKRRFI